MERFKKLHPILLLLFFLVSLLVPLSFNHPCFSFASLLGALGYAFVSDGKRAWKTLFFSIVMMAVIALFNLLFAHYGEDVLFQIKHVSFTFEALFYGLNQGMIVAAVTVWFTFFGRILDSEKLLYLFRFAPKSALIFSMVLGFIPRFLRKLEDIREAKAALAGGVRAQSRKARLREGVDTFSGLVTYSLESSIVTADSMNARGYNPKAVRAARFKMKKTDAALLAVALLFTVFIFTQKVIGNILFVFDPKVYNLRLSIPALVLFALFELAPSAMDIQETVRWKLSNVKK